MISKIFDICVILLMILCTTFLTIEVIVTGIILVKGVF